MKFYRVDCSFVYKNKVKVEHRLLVELCETPEEAAASSKKYLESYSDYSNVVINEVHEETEDEKYGKRALWKGYQEPTVEEKTEPEVKTEPEQISVSLDGELF